MSIRGTSFLTLIISLLLQFLPIQEHEVQFDSDDTPHMAVDIEASHIEVPVHKSSEYLPLLPHEDYKEHHKTE